MRRRFYVCAAATITLVSVGAWLFGLMQWDLADSTASDIRLLNPPANAVVGAVPRKRIVLKGKGARHCDSHRAEAAAAAASENFRLSTELGGPRYGERLLWLRFDCADGSSTSFARSVLPLARAQKSKRIEIARVGFDFRRIDDWLEDELKDIVYRELVAQFEYNGKYRDGTTCPRLPRRNEDDFLPGNNYFKEPIKCGFKYPYFDRYAVINHFSEPQLSLNVSDGFAIDFSVSFQRRIRETHCLGTCGKDEYRTATLKWSVKAVAVETTENVREPVRLKFETLSSDMDMDDFWINFAFAIFSVEQLFFDMVQKIVETKAQENVRSITKWFGDKTSGEFVSFLFNDSTTAKRVASIFGPSERLGLSRVDLRRSGQRLFFSLTAPPTWAKTTAPALHMSRARDGVSLKISYSLINRLLTTILDGRALSSVLAELNTMLRLAGIESGDTVQDILETFTPQRDTYLKYAELRFNRSLGFALPLRIRPVSDQEVRVFFAHAKLLSTVPAEELSLSRAIDVLNRHDGKGIESSPNSSGSFPIGLSVEGNVAFNRNPNEDDVEFLLDHIAFEPVVPHQGDKADPVSLYYGLTPLFRKLLEWDRTDQLEDETSGEGLSPLFREFLKWNRTGRFKDEALGKAFAELRSDLLHLLQLASLTNYFPLEIELYTTAGRRAAKLPARVTVATVDLVGNDVGQNAFVIDGQIGYSNVGAVYVTPKRDYWAIAYNRADRRSAIRDAKRKCQTRARRCIREFVFYRAVLAVARAQDGAYYFGTGKNRKSASVAASVRCARAKGESCTLLPNEIWANTPIR